MMTHSALNKIHRILKPLSLHSNLRKRLGKRRAKGAAIEILLIVSNTLKIGPRLQKAFVDIGKKLKIKARTFTNNSGKTPQSFLASIAPTKGSFTILQVHGKEDEGRLLDFVEEGNVGRNLIVYIHRPEELILRVALENQASYVQAKRLLAEKLKPARAVVLAGNCFVSEYQKFLPETIVVSIPLGFVRPAFSIDLNERMDSKGVFCIGSHTTWGEMRHIDDVLQVLKSINHHDKTIKVIGCAMGSFDQNTFLELARENNDFLFLGNEEILDARRKRLFHNERTFREWLFQRSKGRLIVRANVKGDKPIPESFSKRYRSLYQWEKTLIDFDVQLYHEILDKKRDPSRRGLPKVEYSGTLHKFLFHSIFVVFDSSAMRDIMKNEGLKMILAKQKKGHTDFDGAAKEIIGLIKNRSKRRALLAHNSCISQTLGMNEVAFAFFELISFLKNNEI
jgi:hypothetical protein